MKRITLIFTIAFAFLIGCKPGLHYEQLAPRGIGLYPIASTSLRSLPSENADFLYISLDITIHHDVYKQWDASNDIEESLEEQWKQHLGRSFRPEETAEFIYAQLTDAIITADCEIAGKNAGENLADLFSVKIGEPLFYFPDGEWVDFTTEVKVVTLKEFIDGNYLCPDDFYIYSDIGKDTEEYKAVNFSVVLTLSDGTNEKILTSSCTL